MFNPRLAKSLVLSFFLMGALPAHAGLDFLEPHHLIETIKKQIAKQKIGASADLVNIDVYDGIGIAAKYKLQSEPSYVAGYYTRMDQYTFTADINPGDIVEDLGLPIGFDISRGTDVIYARQFPSQKDSLLALPYSFKQFPINADRAIRNLQVGDFVALQANLNLVLSVGTSFVPNPLVNVGASTHVLVSGQFLVHMFRMPDNKMRVKFIAIRGKGAGVGGSAGLSKTFTMIGINVVDRYLNNRLQRIINFTPLSVSWDKNINDLFMLDYVFDLNDPQAAQAYNDLLTKKVQFKELETTNPFISREGLQNKLLTDISDVEALYTADKFLPAADRRVDRLFKGSSSSLTDSSSFKIGLNILRFETGRSYSQNKVLTYDRNDQERRFLLDTYSHTVDKKIFFGLFGDDSLITTNLLMDAGADWTPSGFIALTAAREVKMKNISARDLRKIQSRVRGLIPAAEYAQIDWKNWNFSDGSLVNGYFKHEIFFHPEAVAAIPARSAGDVEQLFAEYVESFGFPRVSPHLSNGAANGNDPWQERFAADFHMIGKYFSGAFDPTATVQSRYNSFLHLKSFPIWEEHGIGFMLSLLPQDQVHRLVSYEMVLSAKGAETVTFRFGNFAEEELYRSLLYIENVINNRSFDLRLYTDSNGEFSLSEGDKP